MSTPVFQRRRAERFAQLLDEAVDEHPAHTTGDDLAPLVSVARRVAAVQPAVAVDPDFRADLRAMLVATAVREGIGVTATSASPAAETTGCGPTQPTRGGRRARTRTLVVLGVAVGAITVSGISAASDNSLPGDTLYVMKRQAERAQLAWIKSDTDRAQLYLDFAGNRLAEARALHDDPAGLVAVLDDMDADTKQGVKLITAYVLQHNKPAGLDVLTAFAEDQRRELRKLATATSGVAHDRVIASLDLLNAVTQRTEAVRAALGCGAQPSGRTDPLGQVPGSCPDR